MADIAGETMSFSETRDWIEFNKVTGSGIFNEQRDIDSVPDPFCYITLCTLFHQPSRITDIIITSRPEEFLEFCIFPPFSFDSVYFNPRLISVTSLSLTRDDRGHEFFSPFAEPNLRI